jgi:hypothetical protein
LSVTGPQLTRTSGTGEDDIKDSTGKGTSGEGSTGKGTTGEGSAGKGTTGEGSAEPGNALQPSLLQLLTSNEVCLHHFIAVCFATVHACPGAASACMQTHH